ncbi:MAG: hypothetical protein ACKPKO_11680, partial [Candidatus Fonsibacter sp.]
NLKKKSSWCCMRRPFLQLKARVRGNNAYTLVPTLIFTSDMQLVPDMCSKNKRSIYEGYNVADALGVVN